MTVAATPSGTRSQDGRGYSWATMSDFTGGIQQQSSGVTLPLLTSGLGGSVITTPDKPTATLEFLADGSLSTRACYGLPSGGLSGLPSPQKFGTDILSKAAHVPTAGHNVLILGILSVDPGFGPNSAVPSTIALIIAYSSGASSYLELLFNAGVGSISKYNPTVPTPGQNFPPTFPFICYISEAGPSVQPEIGFAATFTDGLYLYSSQGVTHTGIGAGRTGYFFSHQGRIIFIEAVNPFVATASGGNAVSFTDPPESVTLLSQQQLFQTNTYDAITSWGSLSSGELLLLTANNGGIIVANDVFSPYVTAVPGVQGTGGMVGKACVSPLGLIYMSSEGAWVWSGGASSQRISTSLAPNFASYGTKFPLNQFEILDYADWLFFPGNWIYDTVGGGWWIINDPNINDSLNYYNFHFALGNSTPNFGTLQAIFATPSFTLAGANQFMVSYTLPICASKWRYTTNPIQVDHGNVVDVREVVVTARNVGTFTYTINIRLTTAQGIANAIDPIVVPAGQVKMTEYRVQTWAQSDLIQMEIDVTSTDPNNTDGQNFMIGSIAFGYLTRWHLPVT